MFQKSSIFFLTNSGRISELIWSMGRLGFKASNPKYNFFRLRYQNLALLNFFSLNKHRYVSLAMALLHKLTENKRLTCREVSSMIIFAVLCDIFLFE